MSSIDNIFFDINKLDSSFNKKVNITKIYDYIQKKYTANEITKYGLVCFYKRKKNVILITLTNEKVFVFSNKENLPVNGVYSYQDIKNFTFFSGSKINSFAMSTSNGTYTFHYITKEKFKEFISIFEEEKTIFINSKIGQNIMQNITNFNSLNFIKYNDDKDELDNHDESTVDGHHEEYSNVVNKKNKRVVNDEQLSINTSLSSSYIFDLLTNYNKLLPNNKVTILNEIDQRLKKIESNNIFDVPLDSIPLKFSSNTKLNTIPVIAQFSSLIDPDKTENRILFSRNWIEFTKHNVKDKLLGVDSNGNGSYINIDSVLSSFSRQTYKAKSYRIDNFLRFGIRPNTVVPFKSHEQTIGMDSIFYNPNTNEKFDINKYDGIIFMNKFYLFNIPFEFNSTIKKYCRIFEHIQLSDNFDECFVEIIIEDNYFIYNVYDKNGNKFDDTNNISNNYDLKWLTFFKN